MTAGKTPHTCGVPHCTTLTLESKSRHGLCQYHDDMLALWNVLGHQMSKVVELVTDIKEPQEVQAHFEQLLAE